MFFVMPAFSLQDMLAERGFRPQAHPYDTRRVDVAQLFRHPSRELVRLVRLALRLGQMNGLIAMMRRTVERVELEALGCRGIDNIMPGSGGHDDGRAIPHGIFLAQRGVDGIENHLPLPLLEAEELIDGVHLVADLLARQKAHEHELGELSRIEHVPEGIVLDRQILYVRNVSFFHSPIVTFDTDIRRQRKAAIP